MDFTIIIKLLLILLFKGRIQKLLYNVCVSVLINFGYMNVRLKFLLTINLLPAPPMPSLPLLINLAPCWSAQRQSYLKYILKLHISITASINKTTTKKVFGGVSGRV